MPKKIALRPPKRSLDPDVQRVCRPLILVLTGEDGGYRAAALAWLLERSSSGCSGLAVSLGSRWLCSSYWPGVMVNVGRLPIRPPGGQGGEHSRFRSLGKSHAGRYTDSNSALAW